MANKVEIIVVAKDMTGAVFGDVERKAKASGEKAGKDAGDGIKKGIENSLKNAGNSDVDFRGVGVNIGTQIGDGVDEGLGKGDGNGGKSLLSRLTGLVGDAVKAGAQIGTGILSGLTGALTGGGGQITEIIKFAILGAGIASAPFWFPLVSAMAAGIIAGAGVLTAAIGGVIAVAVTSPEVQNAGKRLGENLLSGLKESAEPLVAPVLEAITTISERFQELRPVLDNLFGNTAELIAPLNDALLNFVESVVTGLDTLVEKAGPDVMSGIASGITGLGEAIQYMFERFAEIENLGQIVSDTIGLISDAIVILVDVIATGADAYNELVERLEALANIVNTDDLAGKIQAIAEAIRLLLFDEEPVDEGVEGQFIKIAEGADQAAVAVGAMGEAMRGAKNALEELAEAQLAQIDPLVAYNREHEQTIALTEKYNEVVREKGAASQEAVSVGAQLTQQILQEAEAATKAKGAFAEWTPEMQAAAEQANLSADEIAGLRGSVELTRQALEKYAVEWVAKILMEGAEQAAALAKGVGAAVEAIPSSKTVTINVVTSGAGQAGLRTGGNVGAAGVGRAASGGVRGNMTLVGEEGPELVKLPFGSTVLPTGQTRRAFAEQSKLDRQVAREADMETRSRPNDDVVAAIRQLGRDIASMRLWINEREIGGVQGYNADLLGRAG